MSYRDGPSDESVIGILGGMGPEATINFQRELIDETPAETDQDHITTFVSNDPHIPDRNKAILEGAESPLPKLKANVSKLTEVGSDFIVIPCNTAHYYFDDLTSSTKTEFINMISITEDELNQDGVSKIGLLATETVINVGIYEEYFTNSPVELVTPNNTRQLMDAIYAVKQGNQQKAVEKLTPIIESFEGSDCEALLIGCSDLSVLPISTDLNTYDPITILAKACVTRAKPNCS
ncbi:aspartate/glutamate racemase family protein [Halobaculum limi]|uniref:aspartate/glutamate racemase family protein n=1 Tax=Halobaculum limi TaxID=3031916 RepID=UPI00240695E8|nr:amino acid racemase [Halobaculum sp. YSMS11]